jgi:hypothetical protein
MDHKITYIGKLNKGDKFCLMKDYQKRIVSIVHSKRGYITYFTRKGIVKRTFRYYKEVIAL